jgi:hypothetical protein
MSIFNRIVRSVFGRHTTSEPDAHDAKSDLWTDLQATEPELLRTDPVDPLDDGEAMLADLLGRVDGLVGLSGTLDGMEVEALIDMVRSNERTGSLWIRTATEVLLLVVQRGRIARICAEGCEDQGDRLGDILVAMGAVAEEDLKVTLVEAKATGRLLGDALVSMGMVSVENMQEAVREQIGMRLLRGLEASTAAYAFRRTHEAAGDDSWRHALDPHSLIDQRLESRG